MLPLRGVRLRVMRYYGVKAYSIGIYWRYRELGGGGWRMGGLTEGRTLFCWEIGYNASYLSKLAMFLLLLLAKDIYK